MEAEVYPDERIRQFILENFIPARAHIREQRSTFERFGAPWTPTQLVLDETGKEHYRVEGFLPVDDFLAHLKLGLGRFVFDRGEYSEAAQRFRNVCEEHPSLNAAPEACYWAGVAEYKAKNEPGPLRETAHILGERYPESEWARKASVWAG